MDYVPTFFDPVAAGGDALDGGPSVAYSAGPEPRDTYLYRPRTQLAVNVAMATQRPLLVAGEPGSGKSTLAANVAAVLRRPYYHETITSTIRASDLLWRFDDLRRLNDALIPDKDLQPERHYVEPGSLWWAYDPVTAARRGADPELPADLVDPGTRPSHGGERDDEAAVMLLDEIDKADPDVPNDLLEVLDRQSFTVRETGDRVDARRDVLLIMTTNGERELPPAFMRRCVYLALDPPGRDDFVEIATTKFGHDDLHAPLADEVMTYREAARRLGLREPSTGEYLDALEVCRSLELTPESSSWQDAALSVLWKHDARPELGEAHEDPW